MVFNCRIYCLGFTSDAPASDDETVKISNVREPAVKNVPEG
jgi:hypothetical protein